MDFKEFLEATSPETLQKLAEDAQNEMVDKVVNALLPIMEKQAEYTMYLLKTALEDVAPTEAAPISGDEQITPTSVPSTGAHDNTGVDASNNEGGLNVNQIVEAIQQAVVAGQAPKIVEFVKAIASAHPDTYSEVVKIVKVQLQDAVANKVLDPEEAANISQELNNLTSVQG